MINPENNLMVPAGMRDLLPPEAGRKRRLVNTILEKMALWGYEEISTPLLEYYHVLTKGETGAGPDQLYKLIERDGSILALRPEVTTSIARVVGGKMTGVPPWRLMYGCDVFRYEAVQAGRQRQFTQAGAELIGQDGPEADSEVLALAVEALRASGLTDFTISLGHMGILSGLLSGLSLEERTLDEARGLILEKDFAGLHHFLERAGLPGEKSDSLVDMLTRSFAPADLDGLLARAPACLQPVFAELGSIAGLLDAYGCSSFVQVDLSTLRSQAYYTGMVFEIYTPGIGYPIGGGGRYNRLLRRFGRDCPATGFALGVERLLLSLPGGEENEAPVLLAAGSEKESDRRRLLEKARELRSQGCPVILELRALKRGEAERMAREKGAKLIRWAGGRNDGI
ncbi:MAG: ATP phosphoribosyltransferase regulatory subunit [Peptococcaceae bacterium]|jgi:ATP phosphoribosyltransferase regulatory subunit|nr:ATP phosphoribosyltransferase regulatory subunit [Peptococcaceae bacterium]MDH7525644.1 ATP phosphoribosyltransferase regulatory subunit [Peptococcaceae bacterium]